MKLSEAVKHYEECFGPENNDGNGGCLYDKCPLHNPVKIESGAPCDELGGITWRIEGCSLMAAFEKWLKNKKPGTRYPE